MDHQVQGKRNENGHPQRVLDLLDNIKMTVDFAINHRVNFLLFGGDAYKTNKPLEEYRAMFRGEIIRAAKAGITCVLIPGNHDMTRRSTADHCLAEFRDTGYDIYLVDEPQLLTFEAMNLYCLPWQYHYDPPELTLDKFTVCIVHCTVLEAVFQTGSTAEVMMGRDFALPLSFFTQFDITCLGHIHRPQVLSETPFVGYPGSSEWLTWGEIGQAHGFYYYDGTVQHIEYNHRKRIELKWSGEDIIVDPNAFYRVTVKEENINLAHQHFKEAFELKLIPIITRHEVNRMAKVNKTMSKEAMLIEFLGAEYKDIEDDWYEIKRAVESTG